MNDCKTIICVAISYNIDKENIKYKDDYKLKTSISKISWGKDYHKVLEDKLKALSEFISQRYSAKTKYFVDKGPLVERELAYLSGIGFYGKNCSIINKEYGSFICLGEILTNIYIEPDKAIKELCKDCNLCINACPNGALYNSYKINPKLCLSYLTQQKHLEQEDYPKIKSIYGCDICQNICPFNKLAKNINHDEFIPEEWNAYPDAIDLLEMNNNSFNNTFYNTSSGWRGKKIIQRNAIAFIGNSQRKELFIYLLKALKDERAEIREASIYSLYNLLGKDCFKYLKTHFKKEKDEKIKEKIDFILNL